MANNVILRPGAVGDAVSLLQRKLNRAGASVEKSGLYDDPTIAAVQAFQSRVGLVINGIAGPKTFAALDAGVAAPRHLSDADLVAAADKLGVEVPRFAPSMKSNRARWVFCRTVVR